MLQAISQHDKVGQGDKVAVMLQAMHTAKDM